MELVVVMDLVTELVSPKLIYKMLSAMVCTYRITGNKGFDEMIHGHGQIRSTSVCCV